MSSSSEQPIEVAILDEGAPRQRLPFLLKGALLLWAGAAAVFAFLRTEDAALCINVAVGCCALAGILLVCGIKLKIKAPLFLTAFCLLGCALGLCATLQVITGYAAAEAGVTIRELRALQDSSRTDYGYATICEAGGEEGARFKVRLLTGEEESFFTGDEAICEARLAPLKEGAREFYRSQGVCAQVKPSSLVMVDRTGIDGVLAFAREQAITLIDEHAVDIAPLYNAIVCGYRQEMANTSLYDDFKTCGLAHIVAVSGAHTSLVLMMLMGFLKMLRARKWFITGASIAFVLAYIIFAGMPISAIRSAVMSVLALSSFFARRRAASLNSIGLCIIAFIVLDQSACLSVSFFLSAGSTLGIVLFASLIGSWFPKVSKPVKRTLIDPLSLTLASNVITLPYSAALFSQLSLIAPVANVLATPVFALGCTVGLAATLISLLVPVASSVCIVAASYALAPLMLIVEGLSLIPYASVACSLDTLPMLAISLALAAALYLLWPRVRKRHAFWAVGVAGALIVALGGISACVPKPDEISALDVGQGDAILIRSKGANVLIDTGNADAKLREALGKAGIYHLDAVIVTHPDDDHCASLGSLGGYVDVRQICFAREVWDCGCSKCERLIALAQECAPLATLTGLSVGDELRVGDFRLEVVWPERFVDEGGNQDSLCILGELDLDADEAPDWRALFTGDAESEVLDQLLAAGSVDDIDLLKVGHHGSKVSLTTEDVALIDPEVALISVGANNRYGHPSTEVLECLESVGCKTFRTDEAGTITITFTKEAMGVSTEVADGLS